MIRVVLDTNIVISALLQPLGPSAQVFMLAVSGAIELCISGDVYAEYEDVIARPRFQRDEITIASTLQTIREKSLWVRPTEPIRVCSDPDDNVFIECAHAAQAQYLVTGNIKHFPTEWQQTKVVLPRQLLDLLAIQVAD